MSAHVDFIKQVGENEFYKLNDTRAQMLNPIYHII